MSFVLLRSVVGTSCLDGTPVSQHRALAVGRPHSGHPGFSDFLKSWCLKRIAEFRYPHFPAGLYPLTGEVTKFGHFTDFPVFRRGNGCYTPDHQYLTTEGWINVADITMNHYCQGSKFSRRNSGAGLAAPSRDHVVPPPGGADRRGTVLCSFQCPRWHSPLQ